MTRLFPLLALMACANLDRVTDNYADQSGLQFRDCGEVETGWCPDNALPAIEAVGRCLLEAWEACEPATASFESPTNEGDPIRTVYFVDADCQLVRFMDTTADRFAGVAGRGIWQSTCERLDLDLDRCPPVTADECVDE